MRGKRGRVAEADVGSSGDIEDRQGELLPGAAAAKGPKPSLRNATASRSIFALITLIVIALYLMTTENTSIERRSTTAHATEKRVLVDVVANSTASHVLQGGVPSVAELAPVPVVQPVTTQVDIADGPLPCERGESIFRPADASRIAQCGSGALPRHLRSALRVSALSAAFVSAALSASLLEKHSNVVPGQVRKLIVAVIVDWCAEHGPHFVSRATTRGLHSLTRSCQHVHGDSSGWRAVAEGTHSSPS